MNRDKLNTMLSKGQDSSMLRFGLGNACLDDGDVEEAVTHFQRCVELDADYSAAWKMLGKACLAAEQYNQARDAWTSGLSAAAKRGDKQTEREINVFLKRLNKQQGE